MKNLSTTQWQEKYYNDRSYNLNKYFDMEMKNSLQKFGINLIDKNYTKYECDVIYAQLLFYYTDNESIDIIVKPLPKDVQMMNIQNY